MTMLEKLAKNDQWIDFVTPHGERVATICSETYSQEEREEMAGLIRERLATWGGMTGNMLIMKITDEGRKALESTA